MGKTKTYVKLFLLSLSFSVTSNTFATSVEQEIAEKVAVNYIQQKTGEVRTVSDVVVEEFKGKTSVFGISFQEGGWAIVSSRYEMWPVLAYNTTGKYTSSKNNEDLPSKTFLDMYGTVGYMVDSVLANPGGSSSSLNASLGDFDRMKNNWDHLMTPSSLRSYNIGSILLKDERGENQWNQNTDENGKLIYNNDCPTVKINYGTEKALVGCPAIATSQVMWKWRWPEFAEITQGAYLKEENPNLSVFQSRKLARGGEVSYDGFNWDLIPAKLVDGTTPKDQIKETTHLLRQAGEAIHVGYGNQLYGTGISLIEAYDLYPHAYKNMGFNCYGFINPEFTTLYYVYQEKLGMNRYQISKWSDEEWEQLIKTEIDAGRPVNYCNAGAKNENNKYIIDEVDEESNAIIFKTSGHTYVISGYDYNDDDKIKFYCNLGWGGLLDGFYLIYRCTMPFGPEYVDGITGGTHAVVTGISPQYPTETGEICLDYKSVEAGETRGKNAMETITVPCKSTFDVNNGGTLKLRAGKEISLKSGFSVKSGGSLNAKIVTEFAIDHSISASANTVMPGNNGVLKFNVTNSNSWYLTIRNAQGEVISRHSDVISEDGVVTLWNGSTDVTKNSVYEVTFLNNFGSIVTYSGSFANSTIKEMEKPTIEDVCDIFIDLDRSSDYLFAISIEDPTNVIEVNSSNEPISIYPNPTNGFVSVKASSDNILSITVANLTGKVLMNQYVNSDLAQIDLSSYPKGIYIIQVVTESETIVEKLIVK